MDAPRGVFNIIGDLDKEPSVKDALSRHVSKIRDVGVLSGAAVDLPHRRLEVGPLAASDLFQAPNRPRRLFPERPFLTLNFTNQEEMRSSEPLGNGVFVGPLGKIPVQSQESAVIKDLLFCFLGLDGCHVKAIRSTADQALSFEIDSSLDPSLKELLQRITPLCQHYSTVIRYTEDQIQPGSSRVNQALAGALYGLVKDYYIFVAQLEAQEKCGQLTLNKVWYYIQPTLATMAMLAETCSTLEDVSARGGKTLSLLHQVLSCQAGNEVCSSVAEYLVRSASQPYFAILSRWLHRGVIEDPGKDFFVIDNEVIERSALPLEYSDDYWERRYSIRVDQIPAFLHNYSDMILRTGKYLNVIQQCDKSIKWPNVEEQSRKIEYMSNPEHYIQPLEKAYAFASKTLLDLLVQDRDLVGHLRSVKHYFLLDQGDFIVQFMDLCESELLQNVKFVEPARLESLLELALRTSAANSDPYKDNVGIELLPYDLIYQMNRILSIDTDFESDFRQPGAHLQEELSGLEAFAFGYEVQWPISLVLNRKSLAQYQMLLRHLFFCKHVERLLCGVWVSTKITKFFERELFQNFAKSFALRQKMLNFLQNLEYYMTFEVLEPHWAAMINKIKGHDTVVVVKNVDQVLEIHNDFLMTCLNDCMLSNPDLLSSVKKLLSICVDFAGFMESITKTMDDMDSFHDEVDKFDMAFDSILITLLDKIAQVGRENYNERILNILHRLDFNGFYSKALENFGCTNN